MVKAVIIKKMCHEEYEHDDDYETGLLYMLYMMYMYNLYHVLT